MASRLQDSSGFFDVHPFVKNNPDAVFIMKTNVSDYMNSQEKKQAGLEFTRSVIVPSETGVPLTSLIPLKPNIRYELGWNVNFQAHKTAQEPGNRVQGYKGTDAHFVEGLIEAMKELGMSGSQFFIRECNRNSNGSDEYVAMGERTGAEVREMADKIGVIDENDVVWVDTPEGIWYRKIPYLWPINAPDSFLINIAKFKAHSMGLTLCAKGLQGSIVKNYQAHCTAYNARMDMNSAHQNPYAKQTIFNNYRRHLADGVPRWERPGDNTWNSGIGMETWASRCIDNNAATPVGLHVLEGIYAIDGHFFSGPNPAGNENNPKGESWEYLTNYVIFGMNAFHIDIIGHWLGGHEPGNLGLFHMSMENGLSKYLNPMNIPLYEWKDGGAVMADLTSFERQPLLTYYMQRNWTGDATEDYWHLIDEPFDYTTVSVEQETVDQPEAFVLQQNRPNPFNPFTAIEYRLPNAGNARLEVYNASGQLVDVLVDGFQSAGSHMATWNTHNHSSGVYFYRFTFGGHAETRKMTLLK